MTQEEKQLLLKDLCARVIYGVHCIVYKMNGDIREEDDTIRYIELDNVITYKSKNDECFMLHQIKPYLRPMSGMTEEERKEFQAFHCVDGWHPEFYQAMCNLPNINNMINWLDKKMFDHRGLIPKGLALEAPEGMYNVN